MSIGAIVSVITFASLSSLAKKFSEIKVMIWGGFLFMVVGGLSFIPFSGDSPEMYDANFKLNLTLYCDSVFHHKTTNIDLIFLNATLHMYGKELDMNQTNEAMVRSMTLNCGEDLLGCPSSQKWCSDTSRLTLTQFFIGFLLTSLGYPIGVTLIQTIFSKLLGSKPQVRFFYYLIYC